MASKSFNLQERILESDIGKMDWNNGVGKSKAIVLDNDYDKHFELMKLWQRRK